MSNQTHLFHFTKACWGKNTQGARFFSESEGGWYKKDYVRYYNSQSANKELQWAFFSFELAQNIDETIEIRPISVYAIVNQDIGNRKHITLIGKKKIIEELLK